MTRSAVDNFFCHSVTSSRKKATNLEFSMFCKATYESWIRIILPIAPIGYTPKIKTLHILRPPRNFQNFKPDSQKYLVFLQSFDGFFVDFQHFISGPGVRLVAKFLSCPNMLQFSEGFFESVFLDRFVNYVFHFFFEFVQIQVQKFLERRVIVYRELDLEKIPLVKYDFFY